MRRASRLESLAIEGAERRVRQDLAASAEPEHRVRPWVVVGLAFALFMAGFLVRLSVDDPGALIANTYTVPIALGWFRGRLGTEVGPTAAAAVLAVLPVLIIYIFAQKKFVEGIALTGLKG